MFPHVILWKMIRYNSFNLSAPTTTKHFIFVFKFSINLSLSVIVSNNALKILPLFKQYSTCYFAWVFTNTLSAFLFRLSVMADENKNI